MTKEFTLAEIRTIAEKVYYLIGGQIGNIQYPGMQMKFGQSYSIGSWGKPFTDKVLNIYKGQDKIILAHSKNENTFASNDDPNFVKEIVEYLNTTDTIIFNPFQIKWLDNLDIQGLSILHQFVEEPA